MKKVQWYRGLSLLPVVWMVNLFSVQAEGVQYYHGDSLGSSMLVTKEQGQVEQTILYSPYGEILSEGSSSEGESSFPLYTGQEFDASTDLYDYGARCYDPTLSRFLSVDPIRDEANPQDLNLYSYAWNNPLRVTDPTGMEEKKDPKRISETNLVLFDLDKFSIEEILFLEGLLTDLAKRYSLQYWDGGRTYHVSKIDALLEPLRLESRRSVSNKWWPSLDQFDDIGDFAAYWIRVFEEGFPWDRVQDDCKRVCPGVTKEEVFQIMRDPPEFIKAGYGYGPESQRASITLSFIEPMTASVTPTISFDLETGLVNSVTCSECSSP